MLNLFPHIEIKEYATIPSPNNSASWVIGFKSDGMYIKNSVGEYKLLYSDHTHDSIESGTSSLSIYGTTSRLTLLLSGNEKVYFDLTSFYKSSEATYNIGKSTNPFTNIYVSKVYLNEMQFMGDSIIVNEICDKFPTGSLSEKLLTANAIKTYVDSVAVGFNFFEGGAKTITTIELDASYSSNTLTANSNGQIPTINGYDLKEDEAVVVNNQKNESHNGVYDVTNTGSALTPFVLYRNTNANEAEELNGLLVRITAGNESGTTYVQVKDVITVGTSDIKFDVFYEPAVAGVTGSGTIDSFAIWNTSTSLKTISGLGISHAYITTPYGIEFNNFDASIKNVNPSGAGKTIHIYTSGNVGIVDGPGGASGDGSVILQGAGGNVGIATLTPLYTLDVGGVINTNSDYYRNGSLLSYSGLSNVVGQTVAIHLNGYLPLISVTNSQMILETGPQLITAMNSPGSHSKVPSEAAIITYIDNYAVAGVNDYTNVKIFSSIGVKAIIYASPPDVYPNASFPVRFTDMPLTGNFPGFTYALEGKTIVIMGIMVRSGPEFGSLDLSVRYRDSTTTGTAIHQTSNDDGDYSGNFSTPRTHVIGKNARVEFCKDNPWEGYNSNTYENAEIVLHFKILD